MVVPPSWEETIVRPTGWSWKDRILEFRKVAVSSFQMLLAIGYFLYLEQSGLTLFFLFLVAIESKVTFSQTKHLKNAISLILKIRKKKTTNSQISPSTPLVKPGDETCQPFTPNNLGQPPMPSPSPSAPGQYRFSEERWSNVSENAKGFIRKLLQVDPTQRMTAEESEGVKFFRGGDGGWELK